MIQPADFTHFGVINGTDLYSLPNRQPGDHGGRYVEIEHVHDAMVAFNDVLELLRKAKLFTTPDTPDTLRLAIEAAEIRVHMAIEKLK